MSTLRSFASVPRFLKSFFVVLATLEMLMLFGVALTYFLLQPKLPMFYTLPDRASQLAPKMWIWMFPIFGAVNLLSARIGVYWLRHDMPSLQKLYVFAHVVVLSLFFFTFFRLLWMTL
jgi:hypothetical protein